jgi:uncharacterized protein YacL
VHWIAAQIKWIMLVSGALTCTMIFAAIAPQAALNSTFGASIQMQPLTEIVVRNWGALIALIGAMLIYGAFHIESRQMILTVSSISKLIFIALVLTYGQSFLGPAGLALGIDLIAVTLFLTYLLVTRLPKRIL